MSPEDRGRYEGEWSRGERGKAVELQKIGTPPSASRVDPLKVFMGLS